MKDQETVDFDISRQFFEYMKSLYRQSGRRMAFKGENKDELRVWQEKTRIRLLELLGGKCEIVSDLKLKRKFFSETPDLTVERLLYQTRPGLWASAYLVLPKNVGFPVSAVLCPPGHGIGMNQVVFENGIYKHYPLNVARHGMVALVPENIGFGERNMPKIDSHAFYSLSLNLLGESLLGHMFFDLKRALDVLETMPEVDSKRIGCYGLSLGGELALLTAALDMRVKCTCVSGFFTSYASTYLSRQHCMCGYAYGLAREVEHVDIASLIAPRPLLIESGTKDELFNVEAAKESFRQLRRIYELEGAEERLMHHVFEGDHEICGELSFTWLKKWLEKDI